MRKCRKGIINIAESGETFVPLSVFVGGVGVFLIMGIVQVLLWRRVRVKKEIFTLLFLYAAVPLTGFFVWARFQEGGFLAFWAPLVLYLALACAYLQTYPVLVRDIPTFRIIKRIKQSGAQGLSKEELIRVFETDQELFDKKITELEQDTLINRQPDGRLTLKWSGRILARVFEEYRRLLGAPPGKG